MALVKQLETEYGFGKIGGVAWSITYTAVLA
jgi:hypothetical protein